MTYMGDFTELQQKFAAAGENCDFVIKDIFKKKHLSSLGGIEWHTNESQFSGDRFRIDLSIII